RGRRGSAPTAPCPDRLASTSFASLTEQAPSPALAIVIVERCADGFGAFGCRTTRLRRWGAPAEFGVFVDHDDPTLGRRTERRLGNRPDLARSVGRLPDLVLRIRLLRRGRRRSLDHPRRWGCGGRRFSPAVSFDRRRRRLVGRRGRRYRR